MNGPKQKLSPTVRRILSVLAEASGELYVADVASLAECSRGSASGSLLLLAKWGWVERRIEVSSGGATGYLKKIRYRLTTTGSEAAQEANPTNRVAMPGMLGDDSDRNTAQVLASLLGAAPSPLGAGEITYLTGIGSELVYGRLAKLIRWGWAYSEKRPWAGRSVAGFALTPAGVNAANRLELLPIDVSGIPSRAAYGVVIGNTPRRTAGGRILVALIESGEPELYGLEIASATGTDVSRLYPALRALAQDGMVSTRREESAPGARYHPPRVYYRITKNGAKTAADIVKVPVAWPPVKKPRGPMCPTRPTDAGPEATLEAHQKSFANTAPEHHRRQRRRGRLSLSGSILGMLIDAPQTGLYAAEIAKSIGADQNSVGQALRKFARSGLAESRREEVNAVASHRPPRVFYRLTAAGEEAASKSGANRG